MSRLHWSLAAASLLSLLALGLALGPLHRPEWRHWQAVRTQDPPPKSPPAIYPTLGQGPEFCVACHEGLEEISPSHPVETFGCILCHGGNPLALDKERAHAGMWGGRNPSDFSVVAQTCGQAGCHAGYDDPEHNHVDLATHSLMSTYAGGIATLRYAFGLQPDPTPRYGVHAVEDPHWPGKPPAVPSLAAFEPQTEIEETFQQNCLDGGCHLTEPPTPAPYRYRSTGCAACHVLYDDDGLYKGQDPTIDKTQPGHPRVHRLTTAIPFNQCNHCHNRGNYSLRSMTFTLREDLPPAGPPIPPYTPVQERRLREYYQPIGLFTKCEWELDCIDCHPSSEVMGDGHLYGAKSDAQHMQCRTCHGTILEPPRTVVITEEHLTALRQARLNPHVDLKVGDEVIVDEQGAIFWAIKKRPDGRLEETMKVTGKRYLVPLAYGSACEQDPDQQASQYCHECHAYERPTP